VKPVLRIKIAVLQRQLIQHSCIALSISPQALQPNCKNIHHLKADFLIAEQNTSTVLQEFLRAITWSVLAEHQQEVPIKVLETQLKRNKQIAVKFNF
jgi:hypothetical protein